MPANLPRIYHKKEQQLRFAQSPEEKIAILKEMLAVMPKHKGTDNLRAELTRKISKFKKEAKKKPSVQRTDMYTVAKEGIGQIVLMGPPNSGKSTILASLTNAKPEIASYPFTTQKVDVGMIEFENVQIQLVDTPPLYEKFHPPWLLAIGRSSDILIGTVSGIKDTEKSIEKLLGMFKDGNIYLQTNDFYKGSELMTKNGFIIVSRGDEKTLNRIRENYSDRLEILSYSPDMNMKFLKKRIYIALEVIRIYTKAPGKDADFSEPIVLEKHSTVLDAAYEIHKDFAEHMRFTRLWRGSNNPRQVGSHHELMEGDIVEFHSK